ncbi:single-strand selective monofunctional uracil-DNA glycosylase-like [Musca autumnalis]|uniref:single-strand selective monofunctional uracil-DNA glycosylase-like n=1 Tax=Musca autumnalis TaxID=221902 RepID=UPI003CEDB722
MEGSQEGQPRWELFYVCSKALNETLRQRTPPFPCNPIYRYIYTYHPLEYAGEIYRNFLEKYLNGPKKIVFVGMNPSRYGSLQTGIPFGDIVTVRDRMQLRGAIHNPPMLYPNIPVTGLDSLEDDEEISSTRFWNLIKSIFEDEEDFINRFFINCFVHNFCPLVFVGNNGYNVSFESLAEKIPKETMTIMEEAPLQEHVESSYSS